MESVKKNTLMIIIHQNNSTISVHIIYRYVTSWIETREYAVEKSNLVILFDKYIPPCLENIRNRFKKIIPITEMSHIQMLCHLLECILVPVNTPTDCPKEWYELYFTFVCIWSFGAAIYQEQVRKNISNFDLNVLRKISNF